MRENPATHKAERPTRRAALRRLAGAALAAYVVPEVLFLSAARADDDGPSAPDVSGASASAPSSPSPPSSPSAPSPPSAPSGADSAPDDTDETGGTGSDNGVEGIDVRARDTCNLPRARGNNTISISRSDLERAQEAVAEGYAQPLEQIWGRFKSSYDGNVIGVEFLGQRPNPRYRFRAISKTGRLETVTISAQTGVIQRIVGC